MINPDFVSLLVCPFCSGELKLKSQEAGVLNCVSCNQIFPVLNGIPRFAKISSEQKKTYRSFSYEWKQYTDELSDEKKIFLEETQTREMDWDKKLVLDAGCGMGRFTRVALELGARVVAVDLSESVNRAYELKKNYPELEVLQVDLLNLPFKDKIFDIVYSQGVIHHTPDPKKAFFNLARTVKPGGILTVWVYGRAGAYHNFCTNPLRKDREYLEKFLFIVWIIVLIRGVISNTLRLLTTHLPYWLLNSFSYLLAIIGKIPLVKYITFSLHPNFRVRLQENFDWISPEYQTHHTKEEVIKWCRIAGLKVISILPHGFVPKAGIKGEKI